MEVNTYLPCFSGFYGTIWEANEDSEIDYINEQRESIGLEPITFEEMIFDYNDYNLQVVKGIANYLCRELSEFITDIKVEKVVSPREYNFRNDSANVVISLSTSNKKAIKTYLLAHSVEFASYLKDRYTSRSGFISSYPNTIEEFMRNKPLEHEHKLGAIMEFIAYGHLTEMEIYDNVEAYIQCSNYGELVPETHAD